MKCRLKLEVTTYHFLQRQAALLVPYGFCSFANEQCIYRNIPEHTHVISLRT